MRGPHVKVSKFRVCSATDEKHFTPRLLESPKDGSARIRFRCWNVSSYNRDRAMRGRTFSRTHFLRRRMRRPLSTTLGSRGCRRANARSRCIRVVARLAPVTAFSAERLSRSGSALGFSSSRCNVSRLPRTIVSKLSKSWATPPVRWPISLHLLGLCELFLRAL